MAENGKRSFFTTLPGVLTGIAAVISAFTGLYLALRNPAVPADRPSKQPVESEQVRDDPKVGTRTVRGDTNTEAETVLFEDDFETNRLWQEVTDPGLGNTRYSEGAYVLTNNTENYSYYYRMNEAGFFPPGIRIDLGVRLLRGTLERGFGLLFGATDPQFQNAYSFMIRGDGSYQLYRWRNNQGEFLVGLRNPGAIRSGYGQFNKLTVEVRGSVIRYFVNDILLGSYDTQGSVRGYIGLYTDWPGMEVAFDNIVVTRLNER